jgi:glutamate-ammonia-ligase adenylyltransferase
VFDSLPPDQITEETLRSVGSEDTAKALRYVRELAGQGVTDDDLEPLIPHLLNALRASPDPDRALSSFARWFAAVSGRYSHLQTLIRHPIALDIFCLVTGCSQYFADLLVRQPELFEIIANPGVRGGTKSAATLYRDLSALVDVCQQPGLKRDALRRWKAREMLRIGVRDLIGLADMPVTAREFSNLADACVQKAYDIALAQHPTVPITPPLPFAIIGMGKLGGQELNYSSDIDLMFVHADALPAEIALENGRSLETVAYLSRVAEAVVKILAEDSANGHVFRVDMRLRPEGRFGALTRSLSSFRSYYESWAESWERQALLKARFVAGDRALGEAFMAMVEPFVYRRQVTLTFLEDIRANKRRIEQKCALEGQTETNIKTGYGGIRDIEFLVQLMQLEFGGVRPRLRTPNTLAAIQRLHHAGFLTDTEAHELAEDYQFLRTLEHRLQLLHGFQTQTLPAPSAASERLRVARRMGFLDAAAFEAELTSRRARVYAYLERLFYHRSLSDAAPALSRSVPDAWTDLPDLLDNIDTPAAQERLAAQLRATGFRDIPNALRALQLPMHGNEFGQMPPDTPIEFKAIAPRLMTLLARSPDPDAGLAGIEAIALAVPNRAQLYAAFDDSPQFMERLTKLAAAAPPLLKRLARHLEWMETLLDSDAPLPELSERVQGAKSYESKLEAIARFYQRETLRIGAQDVWEETDVTETMVALSRLAEALLQALLRVCMEPLIAAHAEPEFARRVLERVAIVGLGKLGGEELGYSSDWDVVFVYDEEHQRGEAARGPERFELVNTLVERVITAGKALAQRGAIIEMDLRLRPWGRKGALIHTLRGFIDYYRTTGETWERQAALKARWVAGNPMVGQRFERILHAVSYAQGLSAEEDAAVQAMKRRIEAERLKSSERDTDLKLGYGGLSDIEWLAQRLQLREGPRHPEVRLPSTLRALSALATVHALDNAEADVLAATYCLLTRLRNGLYLQTGMPHDALPADPALRRTLARRFGYRDDAHAAAETHLWEDIQNHTQEVRRIFQQRFYEQPRSSWGE